MPSTRQPSCKARRNSYPSRRPGCTTQSWAYSRSRPLDEQASDPDAGRGGAQNHGHRQQHDVDGEEFRRLAGSVPRSRVLHHAAQKLRPDYERPDTRDDQDPGQKSGDFHRLVAFEPGLGLLGLNVQRLADHGFGRFGDLAAEERHGGRDVALELNAGAAAVSDEPLDSRDVDRSAGNLEGNVALP